MTAALSSAQVQPAMKMAGVTSAVTGVLLLRGGNISTLYEVKLIDAPSLVLKLYPDQLHWKMKKEVLVYGWLQSRSRLPTPCVMAADDTKTIMPQSFIVMTKLDGAALSLVEDSLTTEELQAVYQEMGYLMKVMHEVPMSSFGYIGADGILDPSPTNQDYMRAQFGKKIESFSRLSGDAALTKQVTDYVTAKSALSRCAAPVLCHNDFHAGNVMISRTERGARVTGILDVENALAGDPLLDIAKTVSYSIGSHATKRDGFFAGYGAISRPGAEETVALYQLYHALDLWVWTSGNGQAPPPWLIADIRRITA